MNIIIRIVITALVCLSAQMAQAQTPAADAQHPPMPTQAQMEQMAEQFRQKLAGISSPDGEAFKQIQGDTPAQAGESVVRMIAGRQREVHNLAFPMLTQAASQGLCEPVGKTGLLIAGLSIGRAGETGMIEEVADGSPAAAAGLASGDTIDQINGKRVRSSKQGAELLAKFAARGQVELMVRRQDQGQPLSVIVPTVPACDLSVSVFDGMNNIFDTGTQGVIRVSAQAYREAQDDTERQIVIAHEVAHHLTGHVKTRSRLAKVGRFADFAAGMVGVPTMGVGVALGSLATKGGDEAAADAHSVTLLEPLGVAPAQVLAFWKRVQRDASSRFLSLTSAHAITDGRLEKLAELVSQQPVPLAQGEVAASPAADADTTVQ